MRFLTILCLGDIMNIVYVLSYSYSNPDDYGHSIVGIYYNRKDAKHVMENEFAKIKKFYENFDKKFDDDFVSFEDNYASLGWYGKSVPDTVYEWEIDEMEVL